MDIYHSIKSMKMLLFGILFVLGLPAVVFGVNSVAELDDTMLMFVGEELAVVTVASRTPESPSSAPAVVRVVDHGDIEKYGYQTLAQLLSAEPGFFMADQGMGSVPYLRGISSGLLVLYDGVPVPTGGTRNYYPLDNELSLNNVKQVEIIRGPGSVLWGADAFAGIVNIVPFSGKDRQGVRAKTGFSTSRLKKGFVSLGKKGKNWDAYFSLYSARDRYHDDDFQLYADNDSAGKASLAAESPSLSGSVNDSEYIEFTGNINFSDVFSISGRFSDFNKKYTLTNSTFLDSDATSFDSDATRWASERETPVNFLKANLSNTVGSSHWNGTIYFQDVTYEQMDAGYSVQEDSQIYYGELIWDGRFFEKGLLTLGISYRENHVDGALTQGGFMPDILVAEQSFFIQNSVQKDYKNRLRSLFSQYRHPFSWGEIWFGGRLDDNTMFDKNRYTTSYSLGVNIPCPNTWRVKAAFGTGYRTPYSQQLVGEGTLEIESDEVSTFNVQAEWSPDQYTLFSISAFHSRLSNHVQPDPYAGVSQPSSQDFSGIELYMKKVFDNITLFGSATRVFSWGEDYLYSALSSSYIRPDGTKVALYDTWSEPYDPGADFVLSAGIFYSLFSKLDISLTANYTSSLKYTYEQNSVSGEYENPLLLSGEIKIKDLPVKNVSISVGCRNLLDKTFDYPGNYGSVQGEPFTAYVNVSCKF